MSLIKGTFLSFILFLPLNFFIPIIGSLLSGFVAGLISRGSFKGFLAGLLGPVLLIFFLSIFFGALSKTMISITGAFVAVGVEKLVDAVISIISFIGIFLSSVGGLIGGMITGRKKE
jgi:hypothetical protein